MTMLTRRGFAEGVAATGALALMSREAFAAKTRSIQIGYTGITYPNAQVEEAIKTVAGLGFYGFETFGEVLTKWEAQGGLKRVLDANHLPLISGYCTMNLTEPDKRQEQMTKATAWAKLIKSTGGRIFVLGPNQVKRDGYVYAEHKANIVSTLNEVAQTVSDEGLTPVLHQHTGTCVMTRDETYATLDAVNTRVLKFGPDVGQLKKGGADPLQVVKDYLPLVQHMHLKDFNGKDEHLLGYCPLGQGTVDIPAILDLMRGRKISGMVMVELDSDWNHPSPTPPAELVQASQTYLKSLGVTFRK